MFPFKKKVWHSITSQFVFMNRKEKCGFPISYIRFYTSENVHQKFSHKETLPVLWWAKDGSGICSFLPSLIGLLSGLGKFPMLFSKYTFIFVLPNHLSSSMDIFIYFLIQDTESGL